MNVKKIPSKMITVDMETGEETHEDFAFDLLPPAADKCQNCAGDHPEGAPHNRDSLYYQMAFQTDHGRAPTWEDAMEHCSEEVKQATIKVLEANDIDWRRKAES